MDELVLAEALQAEDLGEGLEGGGLDVRGFSASAEKRYRVQTAFFFSYYINDKPITQ